jgi:hypothetical protein
VQAKGMCNIFHKIIIENSTNLKKAMPIQIQEASRTLNRTTPQHIISKTSTETRERILKAVREKKQITYKGKPIKITADFSIETLKARRVGSEVFQALKENKFNHRILYLPKLSFKIVENKQKLKQFMTTKPPLQKILQGILHTENESKQNHKRADNTKSQEKKRHESKE